MSLGHGASIVRNGLVFQYDMENTAKSWKGKPTTNYAYENGYTSNGPLITENIPNYKELKTLAGDVKDVRYINNNTTNWLDLYSVNNIPLAAGETITISCWIYTDKPANAFNANGNFEATLGTNAGLGGYSNIPTGKWFFFSKSKTNTTASTITVNTLRIETNQYTVWTDSEIDVYAANPQWEVSTFATPFVDGTRSNTQALIDLTGNNTITTVNLTYNSDNTFKFNGTSDYMDLPISHSYLESSTLEIIVKVDTLNTALKQVLFGYRHNTGFSNPTIGSIYTNLGYFSASVITTSEVYRIVSDNSLGVISQGQYYHVVLTKDTINGTLKLYRNGVLGGTQTFDTATYAQWSSVGNYIGADRLDIGRSYNSAENQGWVNYLDGEIPLAKVYDRVLTAEEIKQNFEATRGRYGI